MSTATGDVSSGRSALSVHRPLSFNAAMLALVGRVRFPRYDVVCTRPAFPSQRCFRQWEAANELRACFDEVAALGGGKRDKSGLAQWMLRPAQPHWGDTPNRLIAATSLRVPSPWGLQMSPLTPLQRSTVLGLRARLLEACLVFDKGGSLDRDCIVDDEDRNTDGFREGGGPAAVAGRLLWLWESPPATGSREEREQELSLSLSFLSVVTVAVASCLVCYLRQQLTGE